MTVIRAEQVQSRGDEETFRNRPEALVNRRAGKTTGEWSAHKLPRRLGWPRWEGPEQGSRNCVGGAAERHYADRKVGSARGSRLPHPFLLLEGREKPGVPEEPEPGANDARLKSPRSLDAAS